MQQADSSDPYIDPYNVSEMLRQGDSLLYVLKFANGSGPQDITGYQFVFTVKDSRLDADSAALAQTFYTAPVGTESQTGILSFEALSRQQSGTIPAGTHLIDLRYLTPADQGATVVDGTLFIIIPVGRNLTPP